MIKLKPSKLPLKIQGSLAFCVCGEKLRPKIKKIAFRGVRRKTTFTYHCGCGQQFELTNKRKVEVVKATEIENTIKKR